uniref:Secreted protein n=1 Tax=Rodentolepis nana TaxID=102285 RepID=A0A0R3TC25_RODNA
LSKGIFTLLYTVVSITSTISPVGDLGGGIACHIGPERGPPQLKDLLILSSRRSIKAVAAAACWCGWGGGGRGLCKNGVGDTVRTGDAQKLVTGGLRVPGHG